MSTPPSSAPQAEGEPATLLPTPLTDAAIYAGHFDSPKAAQAFASSLERTLKAERDKEAEVRSEYFRESVKMAQELLEQEVTIRRLQQELERKNGLLPTGRNLVEEIDTLKADNLHTTAERDHARAQWDAAAKERDTLKARCEELEACLRAIWNDDRITIPPEHLPRMVRLVTPQE